MSKLSEEEVAEILEIGKRTLTRGVYYDSEPRSDDYQFTEGKVSNISRYKDLDFLVVLIVDGDGNKEVILFAHPRCHVPTPDQRKALECYQGEHPEIRCQELVIAQLRAENGRFGYVHFFTNRDLFRLKSVIESHISS